MYIVVEVVGDIVVGFVWFFFSRVGGVSGSLGIFLECEGMCFLLLLV